MLSENIKEFRKQKGYTQETLAVVLDVSVSDLLGSSSDNPKQSSDLEKISSQLAMLNDQMAREIARRKRSRLIKLIVAAVVFIVLAIGLFWVFPRERGMAVGDVSDVEVRLVASSMYSQDDIDAAIDVVKSDFMKDWWGCELTLIYYAGDERCKLESRERGVETMDLFSDFKTGKYLEDESSLNTNDVYRNWNWILVRSEDGTWKHIDHGYG